MLAVDTEVPTVVPTDTPTPAPTPTPTATPVPILVVTSIRVVGSMGPPTAANNAAVLMTIAGTGFVDAGYAISLGGRALINVQVVSVTELTGTLTAGLCAGTYTATVQNLTGRQISATSVGAIAIESVRTLSLDPTIPPDTSVTLSGRLQRPSVALASVRVEDTRCGIPDWRLDLAVDTPTNAQGKTLHPGTLTVHFADGGAASVVLTPSGAQVIGRLVLPRNGLTSLLLSPTLDLEIPGSARAGTYVTTFTAAFAPD